MARRKSGFESTAFSFRLTTRPEDSAALEDFSAWIQEAIIEHKVSRAEAIRGIVVGLHGRHGKKESPAPKDPRGLGQLQRQLNRIEDKLENGLSDVIKLLLQNPGAARQIANAAEAVERGDSVGDDFVANILEGFEE